MTDLPTLARKMDRAVDGERGIKLSSSDLDLLVASGALECLLELAEHETNPCDFPPARSNLCSDCAPWVYFIQAGDDGPIKIGLTRKVSQRRSELQTAHSSQLHVRACSQIYVESDLHRFYEREHVRGEWHRASPRMLAFIGHIANG